jgi:hypothetical protein
MMAALGSLLGTIVGIGLAHLAWHLDSRRVR